jgi:hypothetical protein
MPIVASTHISASDNFQLGDSADDKHVLHGHLSGSYTSTGSFGRINVVGTTNIGGPIYVTDNKQIYLGSDEDFALYHNGSHAYLNNTTGNIYYRNDVASASHIFMTKYGGGSLTSVFEVTDGGATLNQGNLTVANDIIIDDGGSLKEAGGTAAFTFDASGHVTKIGQDDPATGQFLKWDGSKVVWDAASGGGSDDMSWNDGTATRISGSAASTGSFGSIHTAGRVGIGTTTPAGSLVVSASFLGDQVRFEGASIPIAYSIYDGSTRKGAMGYATSAGHWLTGAIADDIVLYSDGGMRFGTGGDNPRMYISGTGDIQFLGTNQKISGSSTSTGSFGISELAGGVIDLKNSGVQSVVRFYCEGGNAHYAQIQAPAHSAFSGNVTLTLPATTDTIAGIATSQTFTNKTLTSPVINVTSDAEGDIYYRNSGGAFTRLAKGTDNHVLTMNGNVPNWEVASGGGGSDTDWYSGTNFITASFTPSLQPNVQVTGSMIISGSGGNLTASLAVYGSGSEIFKVEGTNGTLFSVTDIMSGSIFSANLVSGLPVIEAFSNNIVKIGAYADPIIISGSGMISGSSTSTFSGGTSTFTNYGGNISGSSTSTGSFGHIMKGGVNWDTAVSASAQAAGFGSGGGGGGGSGVITALNNATANELVTVGSTITELDAEANLTFDGTTLNAPTLRLSTTTDVSLSSTAHAFQVGATNSTNIRMDNNEIHAVNNGAASSLYLNADGSEVVFLSNSGRTVIANNKISGSVASIGSFGSVTAAGNATFGGDIILDDGGSLKEAGGTAALTFDASGNVTKIGQDVPADQDLLMWNASSGLWEANTAGAASSPFTSAGISGSWQSSNFLSGTVPLFTVTEQVTQEITLVGTNSDESGTTHSLPSGLLENDIVIVGYSTYHSAYGGSAPPSGWTLISNRNYWGANTTIVYYKKMGSTPDTTVTMGGPGADYMSVVSMAFRGVDTTTPFDASATDTQASSGMPNPPAITTVTSGSAIVAFGGIRYDQFVPTVPSGFDDIVYDYGGNANSTAMMACDLDSTRTPGAVDPGAFGGGYSDAWTATTIALKAMINTVSFDWDDVDNSNVALLDLYPLNLSGSSAATASAIGSQGALFSVVNTAQNVDHGLGAYAGSTDYMSYKDDVSTSAGLLFRMGDFIGFPSFEAYTDQTFMMGHYHYPLLQRSGVMRISGSISQQKLHRGKWNLGTTYSPTLSVFGSGSSVTDIVAESGPVFSTYENTSNPLRASERVLFQISNNTGISQLETYDDDSMRIGTYIDPFLTKDGNVRISGSALEQKIHQQHWNLGTLSPPVLSVYGSGSNVVNIKGSSGPHISSRDTLASSRANRTWSDDESYFSIGDLVGYQALEIYEDKTLRYNLKHLKMSREGHMILSASAQEAEKLNEPHWTLGSKTIPALSVYSSGSNITNTVGSSGPILSTAEPNTGRIHRTYTSHTYDIPSIFSVSNAVGLPIVEAFEDNTIRLGTYNNPILDRNGIARISGSISSAKNYPGPWATGTKDISTLTVIGSGSLFEVTSDRVPMLSIEDRVGSYRTNTAYTSSTDALFSVTNVVGIDVFRVMADGTVDLSNYAKTGGIKSFEVSHPDLDNFENDYLSNESRGESLYFGAGSVTRGKCYVLSGSNKTWIEGITTEATTAGNLLGVAKATGTASTVGIMIKGMLRVDSSLLTGTIEPGKPVYLSTTAGKYDFTPTTTSGDIVRTVGYCIDIAGSDILLHFNPDNTSVTLS